MRCRPDLQWVGNIRGENISSPDKNSTFAFALAVDIELRSRWAAMSSNQHPSASTPPALAQSPKELGTILWMLLMGR
jgi:hypothetical protein